MGVLHITAAAASCFVSFCVAAVVEQPLLPPPAPAAVDTVRSGSCPPFSDKAKYRTTNFTDTLNTTVSISPKRPTADVPLGGWISGRATYYGTDPRWEGIHTACGEPAGQFGVLEQGSCGYTNSDGSLPFPKDTYAAVADTNEDYPGSCGRCYQIRCQTGPLYNNGRVLRASDLPHGGRGYHVPDNFGRQWPGDPYPTQDTTYTKCWDDSAIITVRVSDSCPCEYPIKATGEIRTQYWCCGGNNHFDLSFWAFERLAHPSYGVMSIKYRPVDCEIKAPLRSLPGYVSATIYNNSINPGWTFQPYATKDTQLLVPAAGVAGSTGLCATISQGGALSFLCRSCNRPGYQPFSKADSLKLSIRSNTKRLDPFASSTPPGALPALKLFMMNDEQQTYCGAEIVLAPRYAMREPGGWYSVSIPLSSWQCSAGSVGSLAAVDRVDIQNTNIRDADVCVDNLQLASLITDSSMAAGSQCAAMGQPVNSCATYTGRTWTSCMSQSAGVQQGTVQPIFLISYHCALYLWAAEMFSTCESEQQLHKTSCSLFGLVGLLLILNIISKCATVSPPKNVTQ